MDKRTMNFKKIDIDDYAVMKTIGKGSYGRVRLILHKREWKHYAVKVLKKVKIIKFKQSEHVLSEIMVLSEIDFPFCVGFHGIAQDEQIHLHSNGLFTWR